MLEKLNTALTEILIRSYELGYCKSVELQRLEYKLKLKAEITPHIYQKFNTVHLSDCAPALFHIIQNPYLPGCWFLIITWNSPSVVQLLQ
jgi:hypothetical protein